MKGITLYIEKKAMRIFFLYDFIVPGCGLVEQYCVITINLF